MRICKIVLNINNDSIIIAGNSSDSQPLRLDWFTVENVWEKETGFLSCSAGERPGGWRGGCSGASGGRRGCWAEPGGRQQQQQGRGRLGGDSRDRVEGLLDLVGRVRDSYSQEQGQEMAAARC